jgi:hypothetical protein
MSTIQNTIRDLRNNSTTILNLLCKEISDADIILLADALKENHEV